MAIWILELTSMHKQLTDITYDKITYGTLQYNPQNRLIRNIYFSFWGTIVLYWIWVKFLSFVNQGIFTQWKIKRQEKGPVEEKYRVQPSLCSIKPTLMRRPKDPINSCSDLICLNATIIPAKIPVIPPNWINLKKNIMCSIPGMILSYSVINKSEEVKMGSLHMMLSLPSEKYLLYQRANFV